MLARRSCSCRPALRALQRSVAGLPDATTTATTTAAVNVAAVRALPQPAAACLPARLFSSQAQSQSQSQPVPPATESAPPSPAPIAARVQRNPHFARLTPDDVSFFKSVLGDANVLTEPDDVAPYNTDWMRKFHGRSEVVLRPRTSDEVSRLLVHCSARRLAVVPQGGNTGLVGGSVPVFDEVVLSLSRMDSIVSLDDNSGIVTVEAGVVLERLAEWLEQRGFTVPLDLGAKGSCQIGGNVSTNAGGLRYVRYGSLHGSVLGLEWVQASGEVVDSLSAMRKDNTGYDLKQLLIGAEGTLGVITKVALLCPRKPRAQSVALLGCESYEAVLRTMRAAREQLLEIVSAVEFMDRQSVQLVLKHIPNTRDPLPDAHPFYMLLETSGADAEHDQEKLSRFLEFALSSGLIADGTVSSDSSQARSLWSLRESIAESLSKEGAVYKYDVSLPVADMYAMVERMKRRLEGRVGGVVGYGHLGDGNLHLNVYAPMYDPAVLALIEPYLLEQTALQRGSVSAEHGLGLSKAAYLPLSKSAGLIRLMRGVKHLFDPHGILNPYKVLPQEGTTSPTEGQLPQGGRAE